MSRLASPDLAPLFTPVTLGHLTLPNRVMMAPMTRSRATNEERAVGDLQIAYYRQRASAGLILTEATQISNESLAYVATPGIHTDAQIEGWKEVVTAVHAAGGRISAQLWHVGRVAHPFFMDGALPVGPSAIAAKGMAWLPSGPAPLVTPRALETAEIQRIIGDYELAAQRALEAGFDGIQLHAANGYLIDQFLRDGANQRTDGYGGSIAGRVRLLAEVTEALIGVWGDGRVSVRLSPENGPFNDMNDSDPRATFIAAARTLHGMGLAYLEGVDRTGPADGRWHALLRESFHGSYVANGSFDAAQGAAWIAAGRADAISYGAPFISNPDLPERFRVGAPLATPDADTFYQGGEKGFLDYPSL